VIREHKKLERLMLFSEVARCLSFTKAAETLGISRGHLSSQIRQLEKDMGYSLLIRSTRSVRLSAEGARVVAGMDKIRQSLIELERSAESEGTSIEGLIKITAPSLFSGRFLLDMCSQFTVLNPGVEFSIDSSYINHDLNSSDFDLAIRATNQPPLNMVAKRLMSYQHCCCASPKYFAEYGRPSSPVQLQDHRCISAYGQDQWLFDDQSVDIHPWLRINDNHLFKNLALAGHGIVRVPEYLVDDRISSGELEQVFAERMPEATNIYLIHPQLMHQTNRVSAFMQFARDYFV
jgi:DNA-binding transcriptional LysR family regulator